MAYFLIPMFLPSGNEVDISDSGAGAFILLLILPYLIVRMIPLFATVIVGSITTLVCIKKLKRMWTIPAIVTLVLLIAQFIAWMVKWNSGPDLSILALILWFSGWLVAVCIYLRKTTCKTDNSLTTTQ